MPFLLRFVTLEFVPELQFCNLLYCFPGAYLEKISCLDTLEVCIPGPSSTILMNIYLLLVSRI